MTQIIFFKKLIPAIALSAFAMGACAKKAIPAESEVAWLASSSLSSTAVNQALKTRVAFKVNLKTNRTTLYKNGVAVDQWNIASADVSGAYHGGESQNTPTGIYAVDDLQMCPAWYPRNPVNPATGYVVRSEAERASVFANNPSVYGPCGARNPLGRYVFWFNGAYGLHGNSNESILELPSPRSAVFRAAASVTLMQRSALFLTQSSIVSTHWQVSKAMLPPWNLVRSARGGL